MLADGVQRTHPEGGNYTPPDLRNRFIVGVGDSYAVGATGGEATVTLTEAQMPNHVHHTYIKQLNGGGGSQEPHFSDGNSQQFGTADMVSSSTGGSGAHNNLPPYYALCFLYKI